MNTSLRPSGRREVNSRGGGEKLALCGARWAPDKSEDNLSSSWAETGKKNDPFVLGSWGGGFRFCLSALRAPRWEVGEGPSAWKPLKELGAE